MPLPIPIALAAGLALLALCGPAAAQAGKAEAPIPAATLALMAQKGTAASSPVLFRAYKKESEIEVWKKGPAGFVYIKTFPICRWSGQLGPKRKNGDRQTPEGFYTVPRRQMNPNSHYYLSFDVGYPNAYDRAHGGTGSAVMVHGICSSMGCFAMTNGTVGEIYAIAREALKGGQAAFQFQSYPFRMTAENMARHRMDPNIAFWRELKAGSDRFEASREELQVSVAAGRYAFAPSRDPAREAAVATRRAVEEARMAALAETGEPAVRTTYSDGGQNAFWAAYTARGGAVGDISRPEALAFAGQEVVVVPGHRPPHPVPEAVWAKWAAPDSALSPRRMAGFVPVYERTPDPFAALAAFPARYGDGLPSMLAAGLSGSGGAVAAALGPAGSSSGLLASAERL
ncbi:murein L,D-transpeptidase family protein [Methylobacterium sp. NEAU K]|uniref:L,D-transpeptidase family protein n=1 Tax=Methylobacterium sp. NEAU K TaxID=3064946 RepID=UPI00273274EA|nr:murein L,D-transpeptidase family protein [Methylobacterium sp. NEAU K]MDP4005718.1 murein L,D-transpeptidase family protein [Methylobacterium sp. NEAU K]